MTPDIETYAPYIATVFEGCQNPAIKIPFSIADRSLTSDGRVASVVLKLLAIPGGRLPVTQVFDILESTPVSRRFDLDDAELEIIRGWLEETRIRWGMDERDRARLGLPGFLANSWRAGLDRLLLGYAMPEEGGSLFHDKLPFDGMEGSCALTLGKLIDFTVKISAVAGKLSAPRTLGEWRNELRLMLDDFIKVDDDSARELATVNSILEKMEGVGGEAGFTEKVQFRVIRSWLSAQLAKEEKGSGFMTGGVTFCAMLPMRSIPFGVVALIGMNDCAFPRQSRPPGFDLIARNPCRGDRSLRDEDRYLFLESILSARKCFYISYVGQSVKDNSEIPPSVLVNELLDAVDRSFLPIEEPKSGQRLVTRHRLQAFSKDYFSVDAPLFSYSAENCAALLEKCGSPWQPAEFLAAPLAPPSDEWKDVPLRKLLSFFANPAKFFLENRMGIRLEEVAGPLGDREPFAVDGLESYSLKQELLELCLRGGNVQEFLPVARSRGILPPGRHGEALFVNTVKEVAAFSLSLKGEIASRSALKPLDFELDLGGFRLTGRLDHLWTDRMIRYRCAKIKANDQIRVWIEHLILNAVNKEGYPCESLLMMVDGSKTFLRVADSFSILRSVLELYWQGLSVPLRFFPVSGMEYAKKLEWNLEGARRKWQEGYNFPGEGDNPYFKLCFGRVDPFNADFERITQTLLEPLIEHQT
jgi:exodeoxyribonuclease V gamma subunit